MADIKISDFPAISNDWSWDLLTILDVSDTTDSPEWSNKNILSSFFKNRANHTWTQSSSTITELNNIVYVTNISKLPSAVWWVITLPSDWKLYFFVENIDIWWNELRPWNNVLQWISENTTWLSNWTINVTWECTLMDIMITDCSITINNPNWNYDRRYVNFVNCDNVITIVSCWNFILNTIWFINSYGLTLDWNIWTFALTNSIFRSVNTDNINFIEVTANAIVNRRVRIEQSALVTSLANQTCVNVNASATIPNGSFILTTVSLSWTWIWFVWINWDEDKSLFTQVVWLNAVNSTSIWQMYMQQNTTETVINTIWVQEIMAWTTVFWSISQRFQHIQANNSLRYTSVIPETFIVTATLTVISGNNNKIWSYIAIKRDGDTINPPTDIVGESEIYTTMSWTREEAVCIQALITLWFNDEVYIALENTSSTTNITVEFANMIIKKAPL